MDTNAGGRRAVGVSLSALVLVQDHLVAPVVGVREQYDSVAGRNQAEIEQKMSKRRMSPIRVQIQRELLAEIERLKLTDSDVHDLTGISQRTINEWTSRRIVPGKRRGLLALNKLRAAPSGATSHQETSAAGASENTKKELVLDGPVTSDITSPGASAPGATEGEDIFVVEFAGQPYLIRRPSPEYWLCKMCLTAHPPGYQFCPHTGYNRDQAQTPATQRLIDVVKRSGVGHSEAGGDRL